MAIIDYLYGTTLWKLGLIICVVVVGGSLGSILLVNRFWSRELRRNHNDIAGFLIAVVGVIFAILVSSLAIEVLSRRGHAETLVTREAQAIESVHRDTDLLTPAQRDSIRAEMRTYLDAVIDGDWPEMRRAQWPNAANASRERLWENVAALPIGSYAQMLGVQEIRGDLEKLSDIRRDRSEIATSGVDKVVWGVVLLGSASTILFAVIFGVRNLAAHMLMTGLLSFTVALAIFMVVAIDWPYYGEDSIAPERLIALRDTLKPSTGWQQARSLEAAP